MPFTYLFHAVADVEAKFKNITFGPASKPTATEIENEINRTEAYALGKINPFYDVATITTAAYPQAFLIIKEICSLITAGKVNDILRKNGVQKAEAEESNRSDSMISRGDRMLKGIALFATQGNVEGALSLYDAPARALKTNSAAAGIPSTESPIFRKGSDQW